MGRRLQLLATPQALAGRRARAKMTPEEKRLAKIRMRVRLYGLTVYEAEQLVIAQAGTCALCPEAISLDNGYRSHIDHDHETGRVRGILCAPCNRAVEGFLRLKALGANVEAYVAGRN